MSFRIPMTLLVLFVGHLWMDAVPVAAQVKEIVDVTKLKPVPKDAPTPADKLEGLDKRNPRDSPVWIGKRGGYYTSFGENALVVIKIVIDTQDVYLVNTMTMLGGDTGYWYCELDGFSTQLAFQKPGPTKRHILIRSQHGGVKPWMLLDIATTGPNMGNIN